MGFFAGKVVVITGSARGIGLATARLLGSRGAKIVLSDILQDTLASAQDELAREGIDVAAVPADVSRPADCQRLVAEAAKRYGKLDVLINNAGISIVSPLEQCDYEPARKLIEVNLLGSIYMTIAALGEVKRARGHIVFVSSVSGLRAIPTGSIYSASKAALRSFAESLRVEVRPCGVHVGVIFPGFTTSDATKTVLAGDGRARPIDRPPHDTPQGVARGIARLLQNRERERVLTALGKATALAQRLSPAALDLLLSRTTLRS